MLNIVRGPGALGSMLLVALSWTGTFSIPNRIT
jgi:hypothetical protein